MADMMKDNLCITCAKCKGINSDGYIKCPEFPTYAKAKEAGMTVGNIRGPDTGLNK